MARALIVACGCRGRELGKGLVEEGWVVRGTSRRKEGLAPIEAAGIEAALADPERPATLLDLVGDVAVVYWLLGSAEGDEEAIAAIHGEKLEAFLTKLVDTPVRRFVYEAAGTVDPRHLAAGEEIAHAAERRWHIPVETLGSPAGEGK